MTTPTISVLLPSFRAEGFIGRALDSLLDQTYQSWEAIVVDNASDDNTWRIAREFAKRDPRIRAFQNDHNIGPVRNWRRCAGHAAAQWLSFLFADDWYDRQYLSSVAQYIGDPRLGFVLSAARVHSRQPEADVAYLLPDAGLHTTSAYLREIYYRGPHRVPVTPVCAIFRADTVGRALSDESYDKDEEVGFMEHGAGVDLGIYLHACSQYEYFVHVGEPLVNLQDRPDNLSKDARVGLAHSVVLHRHYETLRVRSLSDARAYAALWWRFRAHPARRRQLELKMPRASWSIIPQLALAYSARRVAGLLNARH